MTRPRRPKLVQVLVSDAPFLVCEEDSSAPSYWDLTIRDAISGDTPTFRCVPPRKGCPFSAHQLACAGARELNEARGMVTLTEYLRGLPTFVSVWASNGSQVFCIRSTDATRAEAVDLRHLHERERAAFRAHRAGR